MSFQPRPFSAATACRSILLPDVEGPRVRLLHRVHRARRQSQREHALVVPRQDHSSAECRREGTQGLEGVQIVGVAYKADIDDTKSPALKLIELLQDEGADVTYHDAFVSELPEHGLSSTELDPAGSDCVVIVTTHTGIDYDDLVKQAPLVVDLRNATGHSGTSNEGLEALKPIRVGHAGLGYWGPNLARNFAELSDLRWLCDLSPDRLSRKPPPATRRLGRRPARRCSPTPSSTRS